MTIISGFKTCAFNGQKAKHHVKIKKKGLLYLAYDVEKNSLNIHNKST